MEQAIPEKKNNLTEREAFLRQRYGELLTLEEVAEVLRYPSANAARKAHSRGKFPLKLNRFPKRAGLFATAKAVAKCLEMLDEGKN